MKKLMGAMMFFLVASAHSAKADDPGICYVYVTANAPCAGAMAAGPQAAAYYTVNAFFRDSDTVANMNAGRCIERAREYLQWCNQAGPLKAVGDNSAGSAGSVQWVATVYQVNGINRQAAYTYPDGKTILTDAISRWINLTLEDGQPK